MKSEEKLSMTIRRRILARQNW